MLITEPVTAYKTINHGEAGFTLGGRSQLLPSGCKVDRVLTFEGDQVFCQFKDPVLSGGYVWGWVGQSAIAVDFSQGC